MNRDDIIRMARDAWGDDSGKPWSESALLHLECFATLVAAAEREACAKVCENDKSQAMEWSGTSRPGCYYAEEIRERG